MIVGNGLVARSCHTFERDDDVLIFASGVSNSMEVDPKAFEREESLLLSSLEEHPDKTLVYFSTCSIYDPGKADTPYIIFKRKIERKLLNYERVRIARLPNLIGPSTNRNQFGNFIIQSILDQKNFNLHKGASRYLFWSTDLALAVKLLLQQEEYKEVNVCHNNRMSVVDIVALFEQKLGKKAQYTLLDKGFEYAIETKRFDQIKIKNNAQFIESPELIIEHLVQSFKHNSSQDSFFRSGPSNSSSI